MLIFNHYSYTNVIKYFTRLKYSSSPCFSRGKTSFMFFLFPNSVGKLIYDKYGVQDVIDKYLGAVLSRISSVERIEGFSSHMFSIQTKSNLGIHLRLFLR